MGNILIIEDEGIISLDVKETLKSMGFAVETAADGIEGLEKIKQKQTYSSIILNNNMPEMDGEEFYIRVLALNKDLAKRIVFASGQITDFIRSTGNPFLVKPFSHEQLIEAVKKLTL